MVKEMFSIVTDKSEDPSGKHLYLKHGKINVRKY